MTNELSLNLSLKEIKENNCLSEEDYRELETKMFEVWLQEEIDKWYKKKQSNRRR